MRRAALTLALLAGMVALWQGVASLRSVEDMSVV
jgi:hypothetical protein